MGGDLVLEPAVAGRGAAFSVDLPGEPPEEPETGNVEDAGWSATRRQIASL